MNRLSAILALCAGAVTLASCGSSDEQCLPNGEKGIVLRTGTAEGYRFATIKRANGEEVSCTGKTSTVTMQPGDEVDGWTLTRADAAKKPKD